MLDELWNAYPDRPEVEIRNNLALFRFVGESVFKQVSVLSGGERARLTLAKLIMSHMNLLILDEPTNHLDIPSREALEAALSGFDGTILIISHDRYFINRLATRIFDFADRAMHDLRVDHVGDGYNELCRVREQRSPAQAEITEQKTSANKEQYLLNKKQASDARKQANKLVRLRKEADALEAELEKVEAELYGDAATDYQKVAQLDARKTQIEERLLEIYEELE